MISGYNLKEIRQLHNLTQEEFAAALDITRELVNKMEKGKCGVSKGTSARIKIFQQSRQRENFSQEVEIIGSGGAAKEKKSPFAPYHLQRREQKMSPVHHQAPLIAQKAHAGYIKSYDQVDYIDSLQKFSLPPGVNPMGAVWSYFEVDGESMEPSLYSGDVLLASMLPVEDWDDIKDFNVYVILTTDNLLVKRIYRKNAQVWILLSDNEEAAPQVSIAIENIKQVWTFRRHIRSKVPPPKAFTITD